MEKRKIAIFVEGQAELIVVREMLLKTFEYQNIEIECGNLLENWNITKAEYPYSTPNSKFHFYILNVGNDERVLGVILEQETFLYKNNFQKIIGLRDMYGRQYRQKSKTISDAINQQFITKTNATIQQYAQKAENISFHYAIMEVETWFLALPELLSSLDEKLTTNFIFEKLGFNLSEIDPEITFFHPADTLDRIFQLIDRTYDKKSKTINELASMYSKDDYELLAMSGKCTSFNSFYQDFLILSSTI